jgi:hypothetical protein
MPSIGSNWSKIAAVAERNTWPVFLALSCVSKLINSRQTKPQHVFCTAFLRWLSKQIHGGLKDGKRNSAYPCDRRTESTQCPDMCRKSAWRFSGSCCSEFGCSSSWSSATIHGYLIGISRRSITMRVVPRTSPPWVLKAALCQLWRATPISSLDGRPNW